MNNLGIMVVKKGFYSDDRSALFAVGNFVIVEQYPQRRIVRDDDGELVYKPIKGKFQYRLTNLDKKDAEATINNTTKFKERIGKLRSVPTDYRIKLEEFFLRSMGYRDG